MQQIFVELYKYRQEWIDLGVAERESFVGRLAGALVGLQAQGVEVLGYGVNDLDTDRRAAYDFFSVYRVPDVQIQRLFEAGIAASGWYDYFDQINVSGAALTPAGALMKNVLLQPAQRQGPAIAPVSRYAKKSATVNGHTMTYIEEGEGMPVVFVHGDMMSSFLWHNVIPYIADNHRAIAVDLIGAGDSDKLPPKGDGTYSFDTHARYLSGLLDALELGDGVVLVGHDWGANLVFDWAMKHEQRVRALVFSEALLPPFDWSDWPAMVRDGFKYLRTPEGGQDVLNHNFFINTARDNMLRVLTHQEWDEIVRPYANPGEDRRPTLDWPRSVPFGDDDTEIRRVLEQQAAWLAETPIPKQHLAGTPGGIEMVGGRRRDTIGTFPNLTVTEVQGLHWTPLDDPHALGDGLKRWLTALEATQR
ncbi:haloalkane dehalogenase [Mycobacterium sp. Aquia_216]|uniref:haloalkane dehalogenase n=1 Tax=Mycobacterium sp. Aquia_216 TaxID=2991729 RepID=UPI00227BB52F|nr:haloalkane dehalogenase [Mycobacterium sp. Aquia_216]WAJ42534.1 haloalkane dehalogenase [Mycobacterium sp. Aquia_216]